VIILFEIPLMTIEAREKLAASECLFLVQRVRRELD
jgi:hypothetical protein